MGEKKMAVPYTQYMLCYISYLVAIVLATILRLDEKSCPYASVRDHNYTVHIIRHAFEDMKGYESGNIIKSAIYDKGN